MTKAIGLSGWARSGKDTTAEILRLHFGYNPIAFADVLRDFLYHQNATIRMDGREEYWKLRRIIDEYGWQGYKSSPFANTLRDFVQKTGTEAGRGQIYENVWVDAAVRRARQLDKVVFTDVRFLNEALAVQSLGGEVWRIDRPGVGPANDHPSEIALNDYPFNRRIQNDSSLEELANQIKVFLVD